MGFKEDADFARFLTMGAYAAEAVCRDLEKQGHKIVELERYAKANKIWGVKVKRLRLPDLLCTRCGKRFESKGKTKLEIKLSHSGKPGREWFSGGMRPSDIFAFIRVRLLESGPEFGRPVYFSRQALHEAEEALVDGNRKSYSAGSETDVSWPAWSPSYGGVIIEGAPDTLLGQERLIKVKKEDGSKASYGRGEKWPNLYMYLRPGEKFSAGDLVAGCVAPADTICTGSQWDLNADLHSDEADRFAAIKAAPFVQQPEIWDHLYELAKSHDEDWRIRLEAISSLSVRDPEFWIDKLWSFIADPAMKDDARMECVFVLTELDHEKALELLSGIAQPNSDMNPEVRAAAVWGIGSRARPRPNLVAEYLGDDDDFVAMHAASVLPDQLPDAIKSLLMRWLRSGDERRAPAAAHVLMRRRCISELVSVASSGGSFGSFLALRALGDLTRTDIESEYGPLGETILEYLRPIWVQHDDWLRSSNNEGGVEILEKQRIRF